MNPFQMYENALAFFREKEYEKALKELSGLRSCILRWPRMELLTAYIYREQGRYLSEIRTLHSCLQNIDMLDPEERRIAAELWSLLGSAYHMLGKTREAVEAFRQSSSLEPSIAKKRVECSNALFSANAVSDYSCEEYHQLYREYRVLVESIVPYPLRFYQHRRLRIGYLSADFHEHPLADCIWVLLRYHDRNTFCLYCYADNAWDWVTKKMHREVEVWRDISSYSDMEVAALVRRDEIDILFDLSGHTSGNRLAVMAYHPASVQISGIGDVNSTGMDRIEYFWADRNCCENARMAQRYFVETILHDLHSLICYFPLRNMPDLAPAPCLEQSFITFGCFSNFSKATDEILVSWAELMRRVPKSRLVLKHRLFDSDEGVQYTRERLRKLGLDVSRIDLRGFTRNYLQEYADIDIALDTYPYVGGITTCEALYMGVPVIVRYGQRPGSRLGYNVLKNVGIEELAAASREEYIEKAAALAADKVLIADLHRNLRGMMRRSAFMDANAYIKAAEKLYQKIWVKAWISRGGGHFGHSGV